MAPILRRATPDDIPAIRALRLEVGWQAHDWALLDAMRPPAAALFLLELSGHPVAMGSGISYGRLGVVGNMVVTAEWRRRGLGTRILEAVLDFLEGRGSERIELFATPTGRLLYQRHGFTALAPGGMVELAADTARGLVAGGPAVREATLADLGQISAYDLARYGADRSVILRSALSDHDRPVFVAERGGAAVGFAVLRPGGPRLGPWVADDPDAAGALAGTAALRLPAEAVMITNLPGENGAPGRGSRGWAHRLPSRTVGWLAAWSCHGAWRRSTATRWAPWAEPSAETAD